MSQPPGTPDGISVGTAAAGVDRALLFTDIVGSTRLAEAIGDEAWVSLIRWHDATLRSLFGVHGGREIDHAGDGFFVAFEASQAAIRCAVAIQRTLDAHRRSTGFAPRLRIGVHHGKVQVSPRGYRGVTVHAASRIAAACDPDKILASVDVLRSTGRRQAGPLVSLRLAGLAVPIEVASVPWR